MWWIFGLTIWIACAACTVYLYKIDWNLQFPNIWCGWEWKYLGFIAIMSVVIWPVVLVAITITAHDLTGTIKTFFKPIGQWFKDNISWRW